MLDWAIIKNYLAQPSLPSLEPPLARKTSDLVSRLYALSLPCVTSASQVKAAWL